MDDRATQPNQSFTHASTPGPSFTAKLKQLFMPTNRRLFVENTPVKRLLNLLDHFHAIIFLGLGAILMVEMIWGISAIRNTSHKASVAQTLAKATPLPARDLIKATASLSLVTAIPKVNVGKQFSVVILADSAKQNVDGITAKIHYDPAKLTVVKVQNGTLFKNYINPKIDNKKGNATITAITDTDTYFNGTGMFATIIFSPKAKGQTQLDLLTAANVTASAVAANKVNILGTVNGLTITIQ